MLHRTWEDEWRTRSECERTLAMLTCLLSPGLTSVPVRSGEWLTTVMLRLRSLWGIGNWPRFRDLKKTRPRATCVADPYSRLLVCPSLRAYGSVIPSILCSIILHQARVCSFWSRSVFIRGPALGYSRPVSQIESRNPVISRVSGSLGSMNPALPVDNSPA